MKTRKVLAAVLVLSLLTFGVFGSAAQGDSTKGVIVEQVVPESKFQVKVWTDKLHYTVGETMTISVRSEKGGYLTLYDIQPNGKVNQIYPNYFQKQQQIKGGKVYQIPAPGSGFRFRIAPPRGRDILWAIVSNKPGAFPLQEATKGNPYPQISQEADKFAKSVKGIVVEQKEGWGAGYTIFYIGPPLGARINITSVPSNAAIHLDGVYQGQTPMSIYDVAPGNHNLAIKKSGFHEWAKEIITRAGEVIEIQAQLTKLPPPNKPPTAKFDYQPRKPTIGEKINFDASLSNDPDGKIVDYEWDFGDGSSRKGQKVLHSYSSPGTYLVKLRVIDDRGATNQVSMQVQVLPPPNQPPTAKFDYLPRKPDVTEEITFDASLSHDPEGGILSYEWNLGDGTIAQGQQVLHNYTSPGTYLVTLTVTDDRGAMNQVSMRVKVWTKSSINPRITNTMFIGAKPKAVLAHPSRKLIYVSIEKRVVIIDAESQSYMESIGSGSPDQLETTPDGRLLFVGSEDSSVQVIDTRTNEVITTLKVGKDPAGMAMSPDGKFLYVANNDEASVSVIQIPQGLEPPRVIATIRDIPWPRGVCLSPAGKRLYVASTVNGKSNSVTVIDTTTQSILTTFPVPDASVDCVASPDGGRLYVSMDPEMKAKPGGVVVVNTTNYQVMADIRTGKAGFEEEIVLGVGGIDITNDGSFVFVINPAENNVSVINTETYEIVSTLGNAMVGSKPLGLAITPDNKWVYVANYESNSVSIIDTNYSPAK